MPAADAILPDLALSASAFDRRGDLRGDPDLLPRLLADPATRVVRLVGDRAEVAEDTAGPRLVVDAPDARDADRLALYLGEVEGTAWVGVVADDVQTDVPPDVAPDEDAWRTLRQVGADLDDVGAAAFTTTLALANWHRTTATARAAAAHRAGAVGLDPPLPA